MSFEAYLRNVERETGKTPEELRSLAAERGLTDPLAKAGVVTTWLKEEFGLGHGHAMAIYAYLKGKRE